MGLNVDVAMILTSKVTEALTVETASCIFIVLLVFGKFCNKLNFAQTQQDYTQTSFHDFSMWSVQMFVFLHMTETLIFAYFQKLFQ